MENQSHALSLLHQNEIGYVGCCPCCKEIQFTLGNLLSHLPVDGFFFFLNSIRRIAPTVEDKCIHTPNGKRILLRTPVQELLICLSLKEFSQAKDLLEHAACLLEAQSLLVQNRGK